MLNPTWHWLSGYLRSQSAVADQPGNIDIVASDYLGRIYHKALRANVWAPEPGWTSLGRQRFSGDPVNFPVRSG